MFKVSPMRPSTQIEVRIASGIEIATVSVLRHDPRNTRIMSAVRVAEITASRTTPLTEAFTNTDWSNSGSTFRSGGSCAWMPGRAALTRCTTSIVEASPFFRTVRSTERRPFTVTTFCWTW